jgi:RNA polymerase sigma-70 factor (ECF subfamily)
VGNLATIVGIRPEEAAIVTELKAGSEEAFSWLISQYHQPIYSLVARTLQNPADAPDVTQDIFVKVFRGISGFHGDSSLRTWIYRIALHEASNQRRWWTRHRRQEITLETEVGQGTDGHSISIKDTLADEHDSPFDFAAHEQIRARVEAELREVPDPFRTTVVLRDIEGFAYEEIAEILGVNLGTVKSRLMRGRTHLKKRLTPYIQPARRPGATLGLDAGVCAGAAGSPGAGVPGKETPWTR